MRSFDVPVDLVDVMTVEFEGGALGVVSGTGNVPVGDAGQLDVRAYCEHGYVLLDAITGSLEIHRRDGSIERDQLSADDSYPRFATAANLVDVCLGREPNGSPAEFGIVPLNCWTPPTAQPRTTAAWLRSAISTPEPARALNRRRRAHRRARGRPPPFTRRCKTATGARSKPAPSAFRSTHPTGCASR